MERNPLQVLCSVLMIASLAAPLVAQRETTAKAPPDPALAAFLRIAGNLNEFTQDGEQAVARVELSIRDATIRKRVPDLQCVKETEIISRRLTPIFGSSRNITKHGEVITIEIIQNGVTIATHSWSPTLTDQIAITTPRENPLIAEVERAKVSADEVLVRLLATRVFTPGDQIELSRSRIPELRLAAARLIVDRDVLTRLSNDPLYSIRMVANEKLRAKAAEERRTRISQISEPAALAKAALADEDPGVRYAAVDKITDQSVLATVAIKDEDPEVRVAAIRRLTDQAPLSKAVLEDKDQNVRSAAVERLTDQAVLAEVAIGDNEYRISQAAFAKLTDETALTKVAIEGGRYNAFRIRAVEKLTDQALLAKVATQPRAEGFDDFVRAAATEKITDQAVLGKIAVDDGNRKVRNAALKNLTDQVALARVAIQDTLEIDGFDAILKITDRSILERVAAEAASARIRTFAAARLSGK